MSLKKFISTTFDKFSGWKMDIEPLPPKAIIIGAPHTSYWDAAYMVAGIWQAERPLHFLVKNSMLRFPIGIITRALGGVGVDRNSHHGLVDSIVHQINEAEDFVLCLAPKGTRSPQPTWRSGFYHIAYKAQIPVVFGFIDSTTKTYGWRGSMMLTGDMTADMAKIREFYADKLGVHPERTSVPRLRGEGGESGEGTEGSESSEGASQQ